MMEIYWDMFAEIYTLIRGWGWIIMLSLIPITISIMILRPIKKYMFAEVICSNDWSDSSLVFHSVVRIFYWYAKTFTDDIAEERDWKKEIEKLGEYKAHPGGIVFDLIIIEALLIIFILLWPALLLGILLFGPIQWSHSYHKKKKEFIAKLDGTYKET